MVFREARSTLTPRTGTRHADDPIHRELTAPVTIDLG